MVNSEKKLLNLNKEAEFCVSCGKSGLILFLNNLLIACLLFTIFGLYSLHLGQDCNFDLQNYHFYNPYAYLNHRRDIDITPDGVQFYFSPSADFILYCLYTSFSPKVYAFLLGGLSGISAFGCYKIIKLIFGYSNSIIALNIETFLILALSVTGAANIEQLGTAFNENIVSIFIIWGIFFVLKYIFLNRIQFLMFGSIFLGIAPALKLTSAIFTIAIAICFLAFYSRQLKVAIFFLSGIALSFIVVDLFWMLEMWRELHNPIFPLLSNYFNHLTAIDVRDRRFLPKTVAQWIFYPFYFMQSNTYTSELPFRDFRFAGAIIAIFSYGLFLIRHKANKELLLLMSIFLTSYILWLIMFSIQRYAIPLEYLSGIILGLVIYELVAAKPKLKMMLTFLITSVIICSTQIPDWWHMGFNKKFYEVSLPVSPKNSLIILNNYPLAFMVSSFDNSNIFIDIPGEMHSSIANNQRKENLIKRFIKKQQNIYVIDFNFNNVVNARFLPQYGLTVAEKDCASIDVPNNKVLICKSAYAKGIKSNSL